VRALQAADGVVAGISEAEVAQAGAHLGSWVTPREVADDYAAIKDAALAPLTRLAAVDAFPHAALHRGMHAPANMFRLRWRTGKES
jgi:hypothetical protein